MAGGTELTNYLNLIQQEKTNKIIPENIKSGVEVLGVTGTYEGTDTSDATAEAKDIILGKTAYGANGKLTGTFNGAMIFNDIAEMEACQIAKENDLGVVYGREEAPITGTTEFQQVRFPATVTLSSEVTSDINARFRSTGGGWVDMSMNVTSTSAEISAYGDSGELQVEYTSSDGIHYIREGDTETYDLGTTVIYEDYGEPFDDRIGQFILSSAPAYNGLYQYLDYNDNARIHLVPMSSITKSGSGSSTTFSWDGTFTEQVFRADKLKELARTLHRTEYSVSSSYNIHFALDENNNLIAFEMFGNVEKTSSSADIEANYAYFTDTNSYGVRAELSRVVMDVYDINTTTEEYSYTYRTTLTATQVGNVCSKFNLVLNTLPIMEKSSYYSMENYAYLFRDRIYWVYPSGSSYGQSSKYFSISNSTGLNTEYLKWQICPNQFTLSNAGDLIAGKIALGTSGVITGSLGESFSSSFDDTTANLYKKTQAYYDTLTPVIFNDGDSLSSKFGTTNIIVIPSKTDGTPLIDISNMTNLASFFNSEPQLESICELNTLNATNTRGMFTSCTKLRNIGATNTVDCSNSTNTSNMFNNCKELKTLNLVDTSSSTNGSSMFSGCSSLTNVTGLDTSNMTDMSNLMSSCTSLVTTPLIDGSSCTDYRYMFSSDSNLKTVNIVNIASGANFTSTFQSCGLETTPNIDYSNINTLYNAFFYCGQLQTVGNINASSATSLESCFKNCTSLTEVTGTISITNATNIQDLFAGCTMLEVFPTLNTSKVQYMSGLCNGCTSLTTVPELNTSQVTGLPNMFNNCPSLTDTSLNNILNMCRKSNVTSANYKTLKFIGLTQAQATRCQSLSNYQAFVNAGWTTGY